MSSATLNIPASSTVNATDRLGFTLFMAIALHAVLILGSTFVSSPSTPPVQTLEITLAQHAIEKPPEKVDFLAQAHQLGSGTLEEKRLPSTTERSAFHDKKIRNQSARPSPLTTKPEPTLTASHAPKKTVIDKGHSNQVATSKRNVVTTTTEKKNKNALTKPRNEKQAIS